MKKQEEEKESVKELSDQELKDKELVDKILKEKEYYSNSSARVRQVWVECYKAYMSYLDQATNPFLANLFIPKTHEAVELLTAFLAGANQTIKAESEGPEDTKKEKVVEKLLEFQWRKVLNARSQIIKWIKQGILFGNGMIQVGWDADGKKPFMDTINISDIYMDFYEEILGEKPLIHRIIRTKEEIKENTQYNDNRHSVISSVELNQDEEKTKFNTYDSTVLLPPVDDSVELLVRWTKERMIVVAPTSFGFKILRDITNPYGFIPFIKLRFKDSPLANRAYDTGAIEPTLKIQKAFNDMTNEIFDNVSLINNKMWIKRKGANINPMDLVRRPGGVITVENSVTEDIRAEEIGDIKQSAIEMLTILDNEFQQASMVVNLLKGISGADTATEAGIMQQNSKTLVDMVDDNVKDAMSELGQKLLSINLKYLKEIESIKIIDNDKERAYLTLTAEDIDGDYDIRISADRKALESKAIRQKQLLDFLNIISKDPEISAKFPDARKKIYMKWLEEAGFTDSDNFFEESAQQPQPAMMGGGLKMPATFQGLTPQAQQASVNPANLI